MPTDNTVEVTDEMSSVKIIQSTIPDEDQEQMHDINSRHSTPSSSSAVDQFDDAEEGEIEPTKEQEKETEIENLNEYVPSKSAENTDTNTAVELVENVVLHEEKIEEKSKQASIELPHSNVLKSDIAEDSPDKLDANNTNLILTKEIEVEKKIEIQEHDIEAKTAENIQNASIYGINTNDLESIDSEDGNSVVQHPPQLPPREDIMEVKMDDTPKGETTEPKWFSFEKGELDFQGTMTKLSSPSNLNLAYYRYRDKEKELELKSTDDKSDIKNGRDSLKKTFNEIKMGVSVTQNDALLKEIDWEFWSEVFNNYSDIVKNKQNELKMNITNGIPKEIRGMVWQIICDSNSMKLKDYFINTKDFKSDFEKLIKRDLSRTSFVKNSAVKEKIDDLFAIIKTYSLYDTEVGYTQGMAFITVPLLMNMESNEAFCMLVRLMFTYGFRDFYLPEMPGLHLKIYQFDRLLEDKLPELSMHLKNQNIKSSMYAIQWFLTLFAYKFPLEMVLRIYDVVIAEGLESILKFALNLMIKNCDHLLKLKFDDLLNFLKEKLFYYYLDAPGLPNEDRDVSENSETNKTYQIDKFIKDSMEITVLPITLNKYSAEFDEIHRLEKDRERQVKELQIKNGNLTKHIRDIEAAYAILNKEHVEIANEMVNCKIKIGSLEEENKLLGQQVEELKSRLHNLSSQKSSNVNVDFSGELSQGLDKEIQNAMEINLQVMDQNRILEETLAQLEEENASLKASGHTPMNLKSPKIGSMFGLKKGGKFW